ncbi:MAG TPA: biotin/lipoyl-binding protein, partial [Acidimicrobiales bacterium]
MAESAHFTPPRRSRRRVVIGSSVLVAALIIGGASAWAAESSGNSGYRMASVVKASVGTTLPLIGTIEPVHNAAVNFQVAGQVTAIDTAVGDTVTAGQTVASIDATSLSQAVSSAESTVSSDEAKLTEDEDSETSSATTTTTTAPEAVATTTTTTAVPRNAPDGSGASTGNSATISQDQNTLVSDQEVASND